MNKHEEFSEQNKSLRVSDFDFHLPEELIAQQPPEVRGTSRMLVLDRALPLGESSLSDRSFYDFPSLLNPGDLLVRQPRDPRTPLRSSHHDARQAGT
jgi:hypothetical protein